MLSAKRFWWCLVLGLSSLSLAQAPQPVVMPFPLEVKRVPSGFTKGDAEAIQQDFKRLLRRSGVTLPDFAAFDLALKELKRQDCERDDECLVQLSRNAHSLYALYASVDFTLEETVVASGRVVREDGRAVRFTQTVKVKKGKDSFLEVVRVALTQLFAALKVAELEPVKPVEAKVEPSRIQPPPPPPLVVEDLGAGQRSTGKAFVFVGAGLAVVGAALAGVGAGLGYGADHSGDIASNPAMARQAATAQTLSTVGFVGMGVGAVAAGAGAILWGTAAPAPAQVSIMPIVGGGVLQVGGSF
ncbi:MAG: hypothetical protein Q8N23_21445 [Archangium sp.]|nr:hypothetical protein [Archangium sp.]MDP3570919.1 hypothetical protein [Archangium sp.]